MKRLLTTIVTLMCLTTLFAQNTDHRHMSVDDYVRRQKEFITERAGLTDAEAEAFFPLYFELQKEKMMQNGKVRRNMRQMYKDGVTEEQADKLVEEMADMKIKCDQLEKEYVVKLKAIIPSTKLLKVLMAEEAFQRELMTEMQRGHHPAEGRPQKGQPEPRH